ncbi:MAG: ABC transporter permease [Chloroflexi bacterium]|nr:ABC transporter permease [Chloroflexota bacterium]
MSLYLRLAWRNVWRHRRRTLIIMLAIGLGMSMMMMYDGLVAGFEQAIYGNAVQVLGGNIQIHAEGYREKTGQSPLLPLVNDQSLIAAAEAQPEVVMAARRIKTTGMATSTEGAFGISIIGIEPDKEQAISLEARNVVAGRYLTADDTDQIFIGKGLAEVMEISVGDRITVVGKDINKQMRKRTMTVVGIYDINMPDVEKQSIYISLAEAQDLYGLTGQSTEIAIMLEKIGKENEVIRALKPVSGSNEIETWATTFPELRQALETKGAVMDVFSVIILIIAGIGILNMLLMAIFERTREIGVLGALGMKPGQISILFLLEGCMMGLLGLLTGVLLGMAFNAVLMTVGFDYSAFAGVTEYTALISGKVYSTLGLEKIVQRSLTVIIISILCSFYPAHEASQSEPAHALHYV